MSTTKDKEEPRLELCNWSEEVPVAVQSKGNHYSAKPKARGLSGNYCYQESRFRTFGLRKRRPAFNARKHWLNPTSAIAARLGGGSQLS